MNVNLDTVGKVSRILVPWAVIVLLAVGVIDADGPVVEQLLDAGGGFALPVTVVGILWVQFTALAIKKVCDRRPAPELIVVVEELVREMRNRRDRYGG